MTNIKAGKNNVLRNIPFSPPDISELEINEVVETLKSGWITTGPRTKELERVLSYIESGLSEFGNCCRRIKF